MTHQDLTERVAIPAFAYNESTQAFERIGQRIIVACKVFGSTSVTLTETVYPGFLGPDDEDTPDEDESRIAAVWREAEARHAEKVSVQMAAKAEGSQANSISKSILASVLQPENWRPKG